MKKQKKLVVGNWKMNPLTVEEAKSLAITIKRAVKNIRKTDIVLCASYVYLSTLSSVPKGSLFLGAQDAFYESHGSFTGEVSSSQLYQFGTRFVIVGHSERRARGETDEIVNKKVRSIVGEGMTAILCVGEKERDGHGDYLHIVRKQIIDGLKDVSKRWASHIVIAYEPVWAVGAKEAMRPQEIHEMSIFIKKILRDAYGIASNEIRVLYGGDVTPRDVSDIMREGFVDGVLIGRESLRAKDFVEIIKIIDAL